MDIRVQEIALMLDGFSLHEDNPSHECFLRRPPHGGPLVILYYPPWKNYIFVCEMHEKEVNDWWKKYE